MMNQALLQSFIESALAEDIGPGDYTTLACIPVEEKGKAVLRIKEAGILAGMEVAEAIFRYLDKEMSFHKQKEDGAEIAPGEAAFEVEGRVHAILQGERLVLNCMQRMSGIASLTRRYTERLKGYHTRLLDTRKTTPNFRFLEKEAVRIGGGVNHRMGLYDMIMLKDNHIDFCGGIRPAVSRVQDFLKKQHLALKIEVEARSLEDVEEVLSIEGIDRIMLDNFSPEQLDTAMKLIAGRLETEASGGIDIDTLEKYARTGVDFISAGAVIHHAVSLDLSLKAELAASH